MAMLRSYGAWAAAGVVTLVLGAPTARADDDTYRLGGKAGDADTRTLGWDGEENGTTLTRGYRGGVGHYGYGHYHGGYYGGYRHVGYYGGGYRHVGYYGGGYRHVGFYGGYYRPYVGYYGGYYGGGYYGGGYYGGGYCAPYVYTAPVYYSTPTYYYSQPCYTYPISVTVGGAAPAVTYRPSYQYQAPAPAPYQQPMPGAPGDGTYPYDGGPVAPVPLPKDPSQTPSVQPGLKVLVPPQGDGRLVSLPAAQKTQTGTGGFAYPAYGEQQPSGFASDRLPTGTTAQKRK